MTTWLFSLLLPWGCAEKGAVSSPPETTADTDTGLPPLTPAAWCDTAMEITYDNFGAAMLLTHCQGCHSADSPNRYGAPADVHFDDEGEVRDRWRDLQRVILEEGSMPPAGGLTEDELTMTEVWLSCDL